MRSVESLFQFKHYKIDHLEMSTRSTLDTLQLTSTPPGSEWRLDVSFRTPAWSPQHHFYLGGMDCRLTLQTADPQQDQTEPVLTIEAGIAGLFSVGADRFSAEIENRLVRTQIPGILFPYLRSTLTFLLASAGMGSVILPLLNIQKMAEGQSMDVAVIPNAPEGP